MNLFKPTAIPVVGIVGGIGSGKSTVSRRLAERPEYIRLDGDVAGHEVLQQPEVIQKLVDRFGLEICTPKGTIDRAALAERVFGESPTARKNLDFLEELTHPRIRERFTRQIEEVSSRPDVRAVLLDAAVLLESGWRDICNLVIFIDTPESVRWQRIAASRDWSEQQWRKREANQLPLAQKRELADAVVDNGGSLAETVEKVHDAIVRWQESDRQLSSLVPNPIR